MTAGRDGPLLAALAAVGVGAVFGAWLRWALSYWLNPKLEHLPLGLSELRNRGYWTLVDQAGRPARQPHAWQPKASL